MPRPGAMPASRGSRSGRRGSTRRSCAARPASRARGCRRRPSSEARAAGIALGQPRPALRRPGRRRSRPGSPRWTRRSPSSPTTCRVRAHARRPGCRGADRAGGDHLPMTAVRAAGGTGRARARTRIARPRSTTTPPSRSRTRLCGYEISNWARPGHESRHNLAYWRRRPYEAVGPGAHAFDGATRRWNAARLEPTWPDAVREARLPPGGEEVGADGRERRRRVILGLRLEPACPWATATAAAGAAFGWALAAGLLDVTDGAGSADDPRPPALERAVRPPGLTPPIVR